MGKNIYSKQAKESLLLRYLELEKELRDKGSSFYQGLFLTGIAIGIRSFIKNVAVLERLSTVGSGFFILLLIYKLIMVSLIRNELESIELRLEVPNYSKKRNPRVMVNVIMSIFFFILLFNIILRIKY